MERDVEIVMKMVHSIRSARSDYNLINKQRTTAYLIFSDCDNSESIKALFQSLSCLAFTDVNLDSKPQPGCAILTISDKIEIHLLLKVIFFNIYLIFLVYQNNLH